jgi:hypothetical protein
MSADLAAAEPFVVAAVLKGVGGWCLDGLHAECSYAPCNCLTCPPELHHSRAGQAPRVLRPGDTLPWSIVANDAPAAEA